MKKPSIIFFLLIANITLLLHTAIPHHIHEGDFCAIELSETEDCQHHEHEAPENRHHHHEGNSDVDCELDLDVILPNSHKIQSNLLAIEINILFDYHISTFIEKTPAPILYQLRQKLKDYIPQKNALFFHFIMRSLGLRAPPTSI